jgi:hypothetical protein
VKCDSGDFYEIFVEEVQTWLKSVKKYRALCMNKYALFIVAGDIQSALKHSLRVSWYQAVRTGEETQTLRGSITTLHHITLPTFFLT